MKGSYVLKTAVNKGDIEKLIRRFDRVEGEVKREAIKTVQQTAAKIESTAKINLASYQTMPISDEKGRSVSEDIKSSIIAEHSASSPTSDVVVNNRLAPYVEFGTGKYAAAYLADKPELAKYAMEFYVDGSGTMRERPFLFPALWKHGPELVEALKNLLRRLDG